MSSRVVYLLGFLLIAAGITIDVVTGGEDGWRILRSVLIGGGAGVLFARLVSDRRHRRQKTTAETEA